MCEELEVYSKGIIYCSVCTNIKSIKRIEELVNLRNPTGISSKWSLDKKGNFKTGETNPCVCERNPKTHKHYLLSC